MTVELPQSIKNLKAVLDARHGEDIVILAPHDLADYFVIVTGRNRPHIEALCDTAEESLLKDGHTRMHIEGLGSEWVLLDFGDIIVHVFNKEAREMYRLERLWS